MFKSRLLEETDYAQLVEWWNWFRFPVPAQEMLPENGTCGIMISNGTENVCAGFLYFTNSKICWFEFIVSNPYVREYRKEAICELINKTCELASQYGFKAIYTNLKHENLMPKLEECGFTLGTIKTTEMIKVL